MLKGLKKIGEGGGANPAALLGHPVLQDVLQKAAHLRADLLGQFDERVSGIAKKVGLATRGEVKLHKRQIRELENQVANLEHQLVQERARADRAESGLADATRNLKKANDGAAAKDARVAELEAELEKLKAEAAAAGDGAAKGEKAPASRKSTRATKKKDDGAEAADAEASEGGETLL